MSKIRWQRERAGLYSATINGDRYEIEYFGKEDMDDARPLWICRVNGESFDAAETLKQAKRWCETAVPSGKPLLDVL